MIKVGILGAETMAAGELVRILINHPDVQLKTVASASAAGKAVEKLHRGLVGDIELTVSEDLPAEGHDVVFLCGEQWEARKWLAEHDAEARANDLRIIDLTGAFRDDREYDMVYGLPEWNRKALVRGATRTSLPSAPAMAVGLALFPLAKNHLLSNRLTAVVGIANSDGGEITEQYSPAVTQHMEAYDIRRQMIESTRLDPIAPIDHRVDNGAAATEIAHMLSAMQPGCNVTGEMKLNVSRLPGITRGLTATVEVPCSAALTEVKKLYNEAYEDHNFTYLIDRNPIVADVANTNKCLMLLDYPAEASTGKVMPSLRINVAMDNLLKGGAGNAVHCMNLLFGLSERTGLTLKASAI